LLHAEHYLVSIGRGNTYILNVPPNTTGIIPEYLANETKQLGQAVKDSFSAGGIGQIARTEGLTVSCGANAPAVVLSLPSGSVFDAVVLEEDLRKANQKIASYELQTCEKQAAEVTEEGVGCTKESDWHTLQGYPALGLTVGRKVIERGFHVNATAAATAAAGDNGNYAGAGGAGGGGGGGGGGTADGGGSGGAITGVSAVRFRCTNASLASGETNATAFLKSFSVHKMHPPPGYALPSPPRPPTPWAGCKVFNCTCKGMADYYGVGAPPPSKGGFGCAPPPAELWWTKEAKPCAQPGYSCCAVSDYTKRPPPFPGCG
jgi:hypothetical protein